MGLLVGRARSWITSSGFAPTWSIDCLPNIATDTVITGIACGDSAWNWERICLEGEPIEKGFQP